MPWVEFGVAALSAGASAQSAHAASVKSSDALGKAKSWFKYGGALNQLAAKQAIQAANKNVGVVKKGYAQAKSDIAGAGYAASQGVKAGGQQAQAQVQQGLASKGLSGTSVLENMQSGIFYNTATQLAGIQEAIGSLNSTLDTQAAGAEAAANTNVAQAYGYQANAVGSTYDKIAALYSGQQYQGQSYDFSGLGAALKDVGKWYGDKKSTNFAIDQTNQAMLEMWA